MTTSAYSKSSNSSGFNPILRKFCMIICEIFVYKTVCGIFLISCRFSFINNFIVKSPKLKYHRNLNISRPIYLEKISVHCFEDHICTNKLEDCFFRRKFFQGLAAFFTTAKPLIWVSFFSTKKIILCFFSSVVI